MRVLIYCCIVFNNPCKSYPWVMNSTISSLSKTASIKSKLVLLKIHFTVLVECLVACHLSEVNSSPIDGNLFSVMSIKPSKRCGGKIKHFVKRGEQTFANKQKDVYFRTIGAVE